LIRDKRDTPWPGEKIFCGFRSVLRGLRHSRALFLPPSLQFWRFSHILLIRVQAGVFAKKALTFDLLRRSGAGPIKIVNPQTACVHVLGHARRKFWAESSPHWFALPHFPQNVSKLSCQRTGVSLTCAGVSFFGAHFQLSFDRTKAILPDLELKIFILLSPRMTRCETRPRSCLRAIELITPIHRQS